MKSQRMIIKLLVLSAVLVISITNPGILVADGSEKAFLTPQALLAGWEANYLDLQPLEVSYSERVIAAEAPDSNPQLYERLVKQFHVERIELGERYYIRVSTAEDGFAKQENVMMHAFDGKNTIEYWGVTHSGNIWPGRTGRDVETRNEPRTYLLLQNIPAKEPEKKEFPQGIPLCSAYLRAAIRNSTISIRSELEEVGGELCHVMENSKNPDSGVKIWIAQEKGFIPMKFQQFRDKESANEIEITELAQTKTAAREIWYPAKANRTQGTKSTGRIKYELVTYKFIPNCKVKADTFNVVFPKETEIIDEVNQVVYVVGDENHTRTISANSSPNGVKQKLDPQNLPSLMGKALPEMAALHLPVDPNAIGNQAVLLCFCDMNQRPSRHGVAELVKKVEELKGKGVWAAVVQCELMGQKELEEWRAKYQIPFPVGMIGEEGEKVLAVWGVRGQPWLILTDRQHVVRAEGFGLDELDEKIQAIPND